MSDARDETRGRAMGLGLTAGIGAAVAIGLGAIAAEFLADATSLFIMLGAAWVALTLGRVLWYADLPARYGGVGAEVGLGLAAGLAGMGALHAFFDGGPGWPATPWWALGGGLGWGIMRAHAPVLRRLRDDKAPARRIGGVLDPREGGALALLVAGFALLGIGGSHVLGAITPLLPAAMRPGAVAIALYAIYGASQLLKFAAHDAAPPAQAGFVAWFKANLLRNAIIVLVLAAYVAYRDDLAANVPSFPLVEFGLGMVVFGAVVARLRWRLRRERTDAATASEARPHEQRVEPLTEGEYEAVARPLTRFLETGRGLAEYETTLRETARLDAGSARLTLDAVRRYRAPIETPPLPLSWAIAASLAAGCAVAIGAMVLAIEFGGDAVLALQLALPIVGLALYRTQDHARAHRRPAAALGLAAGGALLVLGAIGSFLRDVDGASLVPWLVFALVALGMLGVPAWSSWKLARAIEHGESVTLPADPPSVLLERGLRGTRSLAMAAAGGAVVLLVVVPFVIEWLVTVANVPADVSTTYGTLASGTVWVIVAMGASALVRWFGYGRARPMVVAREKRGRAERLQMHSDIMRTLERF